MRAAFFVTIVLAACHPSPGGGAAARTSPYVAAYPGLRWVPADATYAVVARHTADVIAVVRELVLLAGSIHDFDVDEIEADMKKETGFDFLSTQELADAGVDVRGGAAVFSQGLSPTFAIALSDPQHLAGVIEQLRTGSVAVEVSREAGIEVYTFAGERDLHVHWAIADRWLFVHVEFTDEHEPDLAWFRALRAAGGAFAASPDLPAAFAATHAAPTAQIIGVARIPELRARLERVGMPHACGDVAAAAGRAFVTAGVDGKDGTGALAVEVAGTGPTDALVEAPAGWDAARKDAPIQAEWNADLDRVGALIAPCDAREARDLTSMGVRAGRVFVHQLDLKDLSGRGAVWLASRDNHLVRDALDSVPGLSLASSHRKVGAADVVDVSVPMLPSFSYALTATTATAAVGGGLIDLVIGDGRPVRGSRLAHLELHPHAIEPDVMDAMLEAAGANTKDYRSRVGRRLRHWDLGQVDLTAERGSVLLTARGLIH